MLLNNLTFIGGAIMCCISNKYILFAGRFLAGFGVGLESVVVPVLLSEIATADTRGTITTLHQLQITFGIFIAGIVGYGFVENVNHGWVYVQVVTTVINANPSRVVFWFQFLLCFSEWDLFLNHQNGSLLKEGQLFERTILISCRPEDAKSSLYILRSPGFDVNAEVSLMIAESNSHKDKDEVRIF